MNKIDKIRINGIGFFICAMFYVYISIIIFLIGWVKPIISIPVTIVLLLALYKYYKSHKENIENVEPIYINVKMFLALFIIVCAIACILGWTGFAKQAGDFVKHNSVLQDLTNKSWPVFYKNAGQTSMLTYYIGQYLLPSLIGKIFSSPYLTIFINCIWYMFGLFIAILGIFKITKADKTSKQIVALITFLFFSVCLFLSQSLGKLIIKNQTIEWENWFIYNDNYQLQYSSTITLLRWVVPQCIVPYIIFAILKDSYNDIEHYVILCLPILFYSSFSFIGIVCFLLVLAIQYIIKNRNIRLILKKIFSLSNIVVALTLGVILIVYFSGNILQPKPEELKLQLVNYSDNILVYVCFIISVLPYTIILFKHNKKNSLFWTSTVLLYILPFFKMGVNNDLCMRISIMPLFIYNMLVIELLFTKKSKILKGVVIIIFLIGSISSIKELYSSVKSMSTKFVVGEMWYTLMFQANKDTSRATLDEKYNYFTYELNKSIFYNYLARKQI